MELNLSQYFFHCTYVLSLFYHSVHKVQNVDSVFTEHFLNPQFPFEMRKTRADRYWFSDPRVTRVAPIKEILYSCSPPPSPPAGNHKVCPRLASVSFMDILNLVSQYSSSSSDYFCNNQKPRQSLYHSYYSLNPQFKWFLLNCFRCIIVAHRCSLIEV